MFLYSIGLFEGLSCVAIGVPLCADLITIAPKAELCKSLCWDNYNRGAG
jgi:hypothetical protein